MIAVPSWKEGQEELIFCVTAIVLAVHLGRSRVAEVMTVPPEVIYQVVLNAPQLRC